MEKRPRRRYLVDKKMQFRYMRLVVIPFILALAGLYYLMYFCMMRELTIPEAIATILLPAMRNVNPIVLITVPAIAIFILRRTLVSTNRTIGPIPRLEKELDRVIAGDYSVRVKTRDNDDLKPFVTKINSVIERLDKGNSTS